MGLQCSLFPIRGDVHSFLAELRGACLLLAQSGHGLLHCKCPLLGVKRTCWQIRALRPATARAQANCFDPP